MTTAAVCDGAGRPGPRAVKLHALVESPSLGACGGGRLTERFPTLLGSVACQDDGHASNVAPNYLGWELLALVGVGWSTIGGKLLAVPVRRSHLCEVGPPRLQVGMETMHVRRNGLCPLLEFLESAAAGGLLFQ